MTYQHFDFKKLSLFVLTQIMQIFQFLAIEFGFTCYKEHWIK